ncbi:MAG TPA: saccharopine dehydrogenase C-terminal domain-containing protein [Thermoanaerobaculia bacterium]|nr:saccharopine dehydrogenase C-terminal domain-containing protein [Thermoanaerobaculia bacterium]
MHELLLLGAGKIGRAIAKLLTETGDYDVLVGDLHEPSLERLAGSAKVRTVRVDVSDPASLRLVMSGRRTVVSACNYAVNAGIARAAADAGLSYFDLTEDVETSHVVRAIAGTAREGQVFMPQCGLAPGFVSIAAFDLAKRFERLDEVRMRVGALPLFPTNELKYNLTWSTDGLINEYGNPCEAVHEGKLREVLPLEGLEHFSIDGVDYEAFNTSGGVGTLAETLAGQARTLNYKTIRYRGHRALVAFLMNELRMNSRRELLKEILESAVPITPQDVVLVFCTVSGWKDGNLTQITDARKVYNADVFGDRWSAIQITTASGLCAVLDLHVAGKLPARGFVRQEEVPLADFLANRFGRAYASSGEMAPGMTTPVPAG